MPDDPKPPSSFLPAVTLVVLIGLMACGYWGFPYLQAWMHHNDCVATGRTNC
jgi:hypothetical protein